MENHDSKINDQKIDLLRKDARSIVRELGLLGDAYHNIGVTLAERHLLIELDSLSTSHQNVGDIAERLLLDKSSASRLIAKSQAKDLLCYNSDPNDKRKKYLQLTPKGNETLQAFEPIARMQVREALLTLSKEEAGIVFQGMHLFAQGLSKARLKRSDQTQYRNLDEVNAALKSKNCFLKLYVPEDYEQLYSIFYEVMEAGNLFPYQNSSKEEFNRRFFEPGMTIYVCHSHEKGLVGGFYLRANFPGRSNHIANAAYMLSKDVRGNGLGRLIVEASLLIAKEKGFSAMQYNMVFSENGPAVHLYKKMGFNIIGTIPEAVRNPDHTYQDGYIMHRMI